MNRTIGRAAALAAVLAGAVACASGTPTATVTVTATPASTGTEAPTTSPKPTATASPAVPTLAPGKSVTFKVDSEDSKDDLTSVTWTMGQKVTQVTQDGLGSVQKGYEDVVFNLTIRNSGPYAIQGDPTMQYALVWVGTDGRTDNTLAGKATGVEDGEFGQDGTDLELQSGLKPGQYVSGYVAWLVPAEKGAVTLLSRRNTTNTTPDVVINYDGLTAKQISG